MPDNKRKSALRKVYNDAVRSGALDEYTFDKGMDKKSVLNPSTFSNENFEQFSNRLQSDPKFATGIYQRLGQAKVFDTRSYTQQKFLDFALGIEEKENKLPSQVQDEMRQETADDIFGDNVVEKRRAADKRAEANAPKTTKEFFDKELGELEEAETQNAKYNNYLDDNIDALIDEVDKKNNLFFADKEEDQERRSNIKGNLISDDKYASKFYADQVAAGVIDPNEMTKQGFDQYFRGKKDVGVASLEEDVAANESYVDKIWNNLIPRALEYSSEAVIAAIPLFSGRPNPYFVKNQFSKWGEEAGDFMGGITSAEGIGLAFRSATDENVNYSTDEATQRYNIAKKREDPNGMHGKFDVMDGLGVADAKALPAEAVKFGGDMVMAGLTFGTSWFASGYADANSETNELIRKNPELAIHADALDLYKIAAGSISGIFDKIGMKGVLGGKYAKKAIERMATKAAMKRLLKEGGEITVSRIDDAAEAWGKSFINKVKAVGLRGAEGFISEGSEELTEEFLGDVSKVLVNQGTGTEIFDQKEMWDSAMSRYANSFALGGILGGTVATGHAAGTKYSNTLRKQYAEATTDQERAEIREYLDREADNLHFIGKNEVTPEAREAIKAANQYYEELSKRIPPNVKPKNREKILSLIKAKNEIESSIEQVKAANENTDPAALAAMEEEVKAANDSLKVIDEGIDLFTRDHKLKYKEEGGKYYKNKNGVVSEVSEYEFLAWKAMSENYLSDVDAGDGDISTGSAVSDDAAEEGDPRVDADIIRDLSNGISAINWDDDADGDFGAADVTNPGPDATIKNDSSSAISPGEVGAAENNVIAPEEIVLEPGQAVVEPTSTTVDEEEKGKGTVVDPANIEVLPEPVVEAPAEKPAETKKPEPKAEAAALDNKIAAGSKVVHDGIEKTVKSIATSPDGDEIAKVEGPDGKTSWVETSELTNKNAKDVANDEGTGGSTGASDIKGSEDNGSGVEERNDSSAGNDGPVEGGETVGGRNSPDRDGENSDDNATEKDRTDPAGGKTKKDSGVADKSDPESSDEGGRNSQVDPVVDSNGGVAGDTGSESEEEKVTSDNDAQFPKSNYEKNSLFQAVKKRWNESKNKVYGKKFKFITAAGETVTGRYVLVNKNDVAASHDPKSFAKTPGVPVNELGKTFNDNDYENNKSAQAKSLRDANNFNRKAIDNPILIDRNGIVKSGNGRTISRQISTAESASDYLADLKEEAANFGFTTDQIAAIGDENVMLAVELDGEPVYNTAEYAKYNDEDTKQKSPLQEAIAIGKKLTAQQIAKITQIFERADVDTMSEMSAADVTALKNALLSAGVITDENAPRYFGEDNTITGAGSELIENMLLATIFDENELNMLDGMRALRGRLSTNRVRLARNSQKQHVNIVPQIKEAIAFISAALKSNPGVKFEDAMDLYISQMDLFGGESKVPFNPDTVIFAIMLQNTNHLRKLLDQLNAIEAEDNLFGDAATVEEGMAFVLNNLAKELTNGQKAIIQTAIDIKGNIGSINLNPEGNQTGGQNAGESTGQDSEGESGSNEQQSGAVDILTTPSADIIAELNKLGTFQEKLEWLRTNNLLQPITLNGRTFNAIDYSDRVMVLLKIGNINMPFYISTGKAGKKNVAAGKWYAVFGINPQTGWINKGTEEMINDQYGMAILQKYAKILDEGLGTISLQQKNGRIVDGFAYMSDENEQIEQFNANTGFNTAPADRKNYGQFVDHVTAVREQIAAELAAMSAAPEEIVDVNPADVQAGSQEEEADKSTSNPDQEPSSAEYKVGDRYTMTKSNGAVMGYTIEDEFSDIFGDKWGVKSDNGKTGFILKSVLASDPRFKKEDGPRKLVDIKKRSWTAEEKQGWLDIADEYEKAGLNKDAATIRALAAKEEVLESHAGPDQYRENIMIPKIFDKLNPPQERDIDDAWLNDFMDYGRERPISNALDEATKKEIIRLASAARQLSRDGKITAEQLSLVNNLRYPAARFAITNNAVEKGHKNANPVENADRRRILDEQIAQAQAIVDGTDVTNVSPVTENTGSDEAIKPDGDEVKRSEIKTVRDLANAEGTDMGLVSGAFFSTLNEGESFSIGPNDYIVTRKTKPSTKSYDYKGQAVTQKQTKITFQNAATGKKTTGTLIFDQYRDGVKYTDRWLGTGDWYNISRDIEGVITVDLINENNKFHDKSDAYNRIQDYLDNVNNPTQPATKPGPAPAPRPPAGPTTPTTPRPPKRVIRDQVLRDKIKAAQDKLFGPSGNLTSGGLDPRKMEEAVKLIGLYIEAGYNKFTDIAMFLYQDYGPKFKDFINAAKSAYASYREVVADDATAIQMDESLRHISYETIVDLYGTETSPKHDFVDGVKQMIAAKDKITIVSMRRLASDVGLTDVRDTQLQEYAESAVIEMAKDITRENISSQEKYAKIVELYNAQPTISMRDSNRIENQQYSTPLPMSFLAGEFVNVISPQRILEPSAGNGMMVFNTNSSKVIANEIDQTRLENLREQGFMEVLSQDGTIPFVIMPVDAVITNPPFGASPPANYNGKFISGLAPQMAINALDAMADNGRAVIIIGEHNKYKPNGSLARDQALMSYLYNNYNVSDIINMDGSLYYKQGTTFPTRMILINGRRKSDVEVYAPVQSKAKAEVVKTFEELYNRINAVKDENVLQQDPGPTVDSGLGNQAGENNPDNAGGTAGTTNSSSPSTGGRSGGSGTRVRTGSNGSAGGRSRPSKQSDGVGGDGQSIERPEIDESGRVEGPIFNGGLRNANSGQIPLGNSGSDVKEAVDIESERTDYIPQSKNTAIGSVIPTNMAQPLANILAQFGNIDEYLRVKLKYKTMADLYDALAAEQIDSVAIGIAQLESGKGMIIGDQTGVGKGRQMAALIRYAILQGKKPIFFTETADLFSDLYRDMADTGNGGFVPLIINDPGKTSPNMTDYDGKVVYKTLSKEAKAKVLENGIVPEGFDYVVVTYSQLSASSDTISPKKNFIAQIAPDNYLFMDESHNAGGEGNTGQYMQGLLKHAGGAIYASGTFAKNPKNMALYALKTSIGDANVGTSELINAIIQGGVPLQEIMAKNLVDIGQMVRRERDMTGVMIDWETIEQGQKESEEIFDKMTEVFNDIIFFQRNHILPLIDEISDELAEIQGEASTGKGKKDFGISNTPFASKTFNAVRQLLFALKAKHVAEETIAQLKAGNKPVICVANTMGSFLKGMDLKEDELIENPDFSLTLARGLDGVFRYTETVAGVERESRLNLSDLSKQGQEEYARINEAITSLSTGITISPIDTIKQLIEEAGYSVGEITGRDDEMRFTPFGAKVSKRKDRDKKTTVRKFNNGELDAVVINISGATGLSMHASKSPSVKDKRQRVMVFAQTELDVNKEVQKRGRIDRTNQLLRGWYRYMISPIPAEQRLIMMFRNKLRSLDANTTSSQKSKTSEIEVLDFLNKYGDRVVVEYLKENRDINDKLLDPLGLDTMGEDALDKLETVENASSKVSGRVALLKVKEQRDFYAQVSERYAATIQYLNDNDANDLDIKILPLKAKTLGSTVIVQGTNPENPFSRDSVLEAVEVDVLKKPMKAEQIQETITKLTKDASSVEYKASLKDKIDAYTKDVIEKQTANIKQAVADKMPGIVKKAEKEAGKKDWTKEETDKYVEYVVKDAIEDQNQRIKANSDRATAVANALKRNVDAFTPGRTYTIPMTLETQNAVSFSTGIFMGFKVGDKITPSSTTAVFATFDGRRKIDVPLSKTNFINSIVANSVGQPSDVTLDNWDVKVPDLRRRLRYIVTGNLLQAYATNKGMIITYSTDTGDLKQGILMPENYDPKTQKARKKISLALEDLNENTEIKSTNGEVFIKVKGSSYELSVPLSRQRGGKYYLNDKLRDLVYERNFIERKGEMHAMVSRQRIFEVLQFLSTTYDLFVDTTLGADIDIRSNDNPTPGDVSFSYAITPKDVMSAGVKPGIMMEKILEVSKIDPEAKFNTQKDAIKWINNFIDNTNAVIPLEELNNPLASYSRTAKSSSIFEQVVIAQQMGNPDPHTEIAAELRKEAWSEDMVLRDFGNSWLDIAERKWNDFFNQGLTLIKGTDYYDAAKGDARAALVAALADNTAKMRADANTGIVAWVSKFWKRVGRFLNLDISGDELAELTLKQYLDIASAQLLHSNAIYVEIYKQELEAGTDEDDSSLESKKNDIQSRRFEELIKTNAAPEHNVQRTWDDGTVSTVDADSKKEALRKVNEKYDAELKALEQSLSTNADTSAETVTEAEKMQFGAGYKDYDFKKGNIPTSKIKITEQPSLSERKDLVDDIKANGIKEPIVVEYDKESDTYYIKNGNNRAAIAKELGISEVPTIIAEYKENTPAEPSTDAAPADDILKVDDLRDMSEEDLLAAFEAIAPEVVAPRQPTVYANDRLPLVRNRDKKAKGQVIISPINGPIKRMLAVAEGVKKSVLETVAFVYPSLKAAGISIIVHETEDSFFNAVLAPPIAGTELDAAAAAGFYDPREKTVHISLANPNLKENILIHEALHPVIRQLMQANPQAFAGFVNEILRDPGLSAVYADFLSRYSKEDQAEEAVVEATADIVLARIMSNLDKVEGNLVDRLIKYLKDFLGKTYGRLSIAIDTRNGFFAFADGMANAISKGEIVVFDGQKPFSQPMLDLVNELVETEIVQGVSYSKTADQIAAEQKMRDDIKRIHAIKFRQRIIDDSGHDFEADAAKFIAAGLYTKEEMDSMLGGWRNAKTLNANPDDRRTIILNMEELQQMVQYEDDADSKMNKTVIAEYQKEIPSMYEIRDRLEYTPQKILEITEKAIKSGKSHPESVIQFLLEANDQERGISAQELVAVSIAMKEIDKAVEIYSDMLAVASSYESATMIQRSIDALYETQSIIAEQFSYNRSVSGLILGIGSKLIKLGGMSYEGTIRSIEEVLSAKNNANGTAEAMSQEDKDKLKELIEKNNKLEKDIQESLEKYDALKLAQASTQKQASAQKAVSTRLRSKALGSRPTQSLEDAVKKAEEFAANIRNGIAFSRTTGTMTDDQKDRYFEAINNIVDNLILAGASKFKDIIEEVKRLAPSITEEDIYDAINSTRPDENQKVRDEYEERKKVVRAAVKALNTLERLVNDDIADLIKKPDTVVPPKIDKVQELIKTLEDNIYQLDLDQHMMDQVVNRLAQIKDEYDMTFTGNLTSNAVRGRIKNLMTLIQNSKLKARLIKEEEKLKEKLAIINDKSRGPAEVISPKSEAPKILEDSELSHKLRVNRDMKREIAGIVKKYKNVDTFYTWLDRTTNTVKIKASFDMSAVLIHGFPSIAMAMFDPKMRGAMKEALVKSHKAVWNALVRALEKDFDPSDPASKAPIDNLADLMHQEIKTHPLYDEFMAFGAQINGPEEQSYVDETMAYDDLPHWVYEKLKGKDGFFNKLAYYPVAFIEQVKYISNVAFATHLNILAMRQYEFYIQNAVEKLKVEPTPREKLLMVNQINKSIGRGDIFMSRNKNSFSLKDRAKNAFSVVWGAMLWAPKMYASFISLAYSPISAIAKLTYFRGERNKDVRRVYSRQLARGLALWAGMATAQALNYARVLIDCDEAEKGVNFDWDKSSFGKAYCGDITFENTGNILQWLRLGMKFFYIAATMNHIQVGTNKKYGLDDLFKDFLYNHANPKISAGVTVLMGRNFFDQKFYEEDKVTPQGWALNRVMAIGSTIIPISIGNIHSALTEPNSEKTKWYQKIGYTVETAYGENIQFKPIRTAAASNGTLKDVKGDANAIGADFGGEFEDGQNMKFNEIKATGQQVNGHNVYSTWDTNRDGKANDYFIIMTRESGKNKGKKHKVRVELQ